MTATLLNLLGWFLFFFVGIPLSIGLHEVGHLVPAKAFGVKCSQYMIGFGTTLWSRRVGETEYGVKAIPLGGYVRMLGMFPPKAGRAARKDSTGRFGLLIDQARQDANKEVGPGDANRLFYQRSVPKKITMMLGGPMMNLLVAVVLITISVTAVGVHEVTTRVGSVSPCVPAAADGATVKCADPTAKAPAYAAGVKAGDVIVAVDGTKVTTWEPVRDAIRNSAAKPITLVVERDGKQVTIVATPVPFPGQKIVNNQVVRGKDGKPVAQEVGFLGITPSDELVRQPVTVVPKIVGNLLTSVGGVLITLPEKLVGVAQAAFGNAPRDPEGLVGLVGMAQLSGQQLAQKDIGVADKVASILNMIIALNLSLFAFNLIPLLPLDGGHIAGALWEGVRRRFARLRGLPDPGPVDVAKALPLAYGVATVLIGMSVLLMYADIVRPIKLNG